MTEQTPEQNPEPTPAPVVERSSEPQRYAVYDTLELRFRGKVHDTKTSAEDHKKGLKVEGDKRGRYEVREV